ncbi:hypothetical protein [Bacteroides heparinolyticus]|uniref:hypothetical protein n=1 Tax=Prevotella heparinolytica TaxID=28113 RepID=UPI003AF16797
MDYKEQIKSPKWQKRRLEIMGKDDFACQICGNKESTLNVHHLCYHSNSNIWDYEDWELITLCEECHKNEHSLAEDIQERIECLRKSGVTMFEIYALLEKVDVSLYLGNDSVIHNIVGNECGIIRDDEIKLLTERRQKLKAPYYEKRRNERNEKTQNDEDPF